MANKGLFPETEVIIFHLYLTAESHRIPKSRCHIGRCSSKASLTTSVGSHQQAVRGDVLSKRLDSASGNEYEICKVTALRSPRDKGKRIWCRPSLR